MTAQELAQCTGARLDRAERFLDAIEAAMAEFGIDTPERQAAFLAQVGHESGGLHYTVEIWGPTAQQARYEGRADLGNTEPGDGFKFRGRSLIQTTGRANYEKVGAALGLDLIENPDLLAEPVTAARAAGYFWQSHNLNALADSGDFERLTKRINGGLNGYAERCALHDAACAVLA